MPPFPKGHYDVLDWRLFRDGPIARYKDADLMSQHVRSLRLMGYRVVEFDCRAWENERAMHDQFKLELDFPDYYGRNLDALNDCLRSDGLIKPGWLGLVIVLRNFGTLSSNPGFRATTPGHVIDIITKQSRQQMLFGDRFMTLVHEATM